MRLTEIENSLAIFCMATYGEGDPTDNAQEFFDWLTDGSAELEGVNFAVSISTIRLGVVLKLHLFAFLICVFYTHCSSTMKFYLL